jgi:hypothetical protein
VLFCTISTFPLQALKKYCDAVVFKIPMKKFIFSIVTAFVVGICLGFLIHDFYYTDLCLDLGGGKNPGNYPVCVIEK